ncbi:hypothetical protein B0I18_10711 [Taibaiella chishuiensis]|uniref:Uncharacterized protein n=1 Tax=Taibaiella chishuiensis TaxID=1434707 RepID=A0A2P8D058_9BACT|nr:hypothetical protein B0I18_10711 [Taibaiella chishuiensis]
MLLFFYPIIKIITPYSVGNSNTSRYCPTSNRNKSNASSNYCNGSSGGSAFISTVIEIICHCNSRSNNV